MGNIFFENENASAKLEKGVLIASYMKEIVDLTIAKNAVKTRLNASKGKSYPFLIDLRNVKNSTKSARQFLASEKGCEGIISAAILINSGVGSMLGNFFILFDKPLVPTKLFSNEGEAMEWLMQFVVIKN